MGFKKTCLTLLLCCLYKLQGNKTQRPSQALFGAQHKEGYSFPGQLTRSETAAFDFSWVPEAFSPEMVTTSVLPEAISEHKLGGLCT